jgi:soluble lytic murein transglycosylase-like protein
VNPRALIALLLGGGLIAYVLYNASEVSGDLASGAEDVQAAVSGWQSVNEGPVWVPFLNAAEQQLGIPTNLLARLAYEESHFRQDIITGAAPSSAGALGLMQLEPQYFSSVQVALPFTASDTQAQIQQAGEQLVSLYNQFQDWGYALAAYNDGAGNVESFIAGTRPLPAATTQYVADIITDVPVPTKLEA